MSISESEYADMLARAKANGASFPESLGSVKCGTLPTDVPISEQDTLEAPIQAEITKLLQEDGWRALRTDPVSDRERGKGFGEVGMADYLYIRYLASGTLVKMLGGCGCLKDKTIAAKTELLWIEFKRSKGGIVSKAQRAWHTKERARGALTLIAGEDFSASVQGFKIWYAASGLQRRK